MNNTNIKTEKLTKIYSNGKVTTHALRGISIEIPKWFILLYHRTFGAWEKHTDAHDKQGKTVVIVTHNQEIANRAERIYKIKDGRLVA